MPLGSRWSGILSWRVATMVFGGVGLFMVGLALRQARRLDVALETWPRVRAHVDSAAVVTPTERREAVYAPRVWVSYTLDGRPFAATATDNVFTSGYGSVARAVERAKRAGVVVALANPQSPQELTLNPGYNWKFFFGPLLLGGLGLWFCGFGALGLVMWRRRGGRAAASASRAMPRRAAMVFLPLMGMVFVGGGLWGIYFLHHQRTTWRPLTARVDSADVVWRSSSSSRHGRRTDLYATRLWLTYDVSGREYRAPMVRGAYYSGYNSVARRTAEAQREGTARILVDPDDPYDVVAKPTGMGLLWLPAIFVVCGLIMFAVMIAIARPSRKTRRRRRSRTRAPAAPPAAQGGTT